MLDDRSYMRAPRRQYWSVTTILLISLVACYGIQWLLEKQMGADRADDLFALSLEGLKNGNIYQLLTFQFMHGSILHLVCNMIGLYSFGRAVEEMLGPRRMLLLYLLSGTIGGLCHVALCLAFPVHFYQRVVGASAGIFGLGAAFAASMPNQSISILVYFILPVTMRAKWLLIIGAAASIVGLFMGGGVAHGAHLGGLLTGIAFIKWGGWLERAGGSWGVATRRRPSRQMARTPVLRAARRPGGTAEELPPAEFISREVDPILEKISAHGIHSLTDRERGILEAARSKMARR